MRSLKTTPKKDDASCERSYYCEYKEQYNQELNPFLYRELMNGLNNTLKGKSDAILGRNRAKSKIKKRKR